MTTPTPTPTAARTVPCHLIAGPLGVGKTTAIIDYLRRHAREQFVAVLVNDFGPIGLDSEVIAADSDRATDDALAVVNVPGGCVCCSAAEGLVTGLTRIARLPRVDRIIVEPSGVAMPGEIADLLRQIRLPFTLELRPTIVIMDPGDVTAQADASIRVPYFDQMVEAADIIVANRCDLASASTMAAFASFAESIYPPKLRIVTTSHGRLPDELFELRREVAEAPRFRFTPLTPHVVTQQSDGITWPAAMEFRLDALLPRITSLARDGIGGVKVDRLKGLFNTDSGWRLIEVARGSVHHRRTGYRGENRADWITSGGAIPVTIMRTRLIEALKQPAY